MMSNIISHSKEAEVGKRAGLRGKVIPVLTIILVIAITVTLFLCRDRVGELGDYGYLGAFLISLVGNAGVILAAPVLPVLSAIGIILYSVTGLAGPVIVGLVGGVGAGIGEMVGYAVGQTGRGVVKNNKMYLRLVVWIRRWGAIAIFILSMFPFFFDVVGIAAGILRYPFWKFFLACWLGRTVLYVVFVVLAALGWEAVLGFFG